MNNEVPLRFHHLSRIKQLIHQPATEIASISLQTIKRPAIAGGDNPWTNFYTEKYIDMLGISPIDSSDIVITKNENAWIGMMKASLLRYESLTDNQQMRLISHGKDWICDCVVFGEHCFNRGEQSIERELLISKSLIRKKSEMRLKEPYWETNTHEFGYSVLTSMGLLRAILYSVPSFEALFVDQIPRE